MGNHATRELADEQAAAIVAQLHAAGERILPTTETNDDDGPTLWVPWWDAVGRTLVSGDLIAQVRRTAAVQHPGPYELYVEMWSQNHECWCRPELDPTGRVEVQR